MNHVAVMGQLKQEGSYERRNVDCIVLSVMYKVSLVMVICGCALRMMNYES